MYHVLVFVQGEPYTIAKRLEFKTGTRHGDNERQARLRSSVLFCLNTNREPSTLISVRPVDTNGGVGTTNLGVNHVYRFGYAETPVQTADTRIERLFPLRVCTTRKIVQSNVRHRFYGFSGVFFPVGRQRKLR